MNAVSCANMALAGVDYAIPCDEVIDAMGRVGSLLSPDLRETGQGALPQRRPVSASPSVWQRKPEVRTENVEKTYFSVRKNIKRK